MSHFGIEMDPPKLEGTPYKFHVYIASNPKDDALHALVSHLRDAKLFVYEDLDPTIPNIDEGISLSRKVVFLVTKKYLEYEFRDEQVATAMRNAQSISRDFILVLVAKDVSRKQVEDLKLENYRSVDLPADGDYEDTNVKFHVADSVTQNRELRCNMGASMAYTYYYGYLRIILHGIRQRVMDSGFMEGIKDRNNDQNLNERNMSKKLFVIIPESLKGPPNLGSLDSRIKALGKVEYKASRGGHKDKDYSTPVYSISDSDSGSLPAVDSPGMPQKYLFLGEVPSILINLYDMKESNIPIDDHRRNVEVQQFYYYLQFLLEDDPDCRDHYCFIYHRDEDTRNYQQIGDILLSKIKEEIWLEVSQESQEPPVRLVDRCIADTETLEISELPLKARCYTRPLQYYQIVPRYSEEPKRLGVTGNGDLVSQQGDGRPLPIGKALIISNRTFCPESDLIPRRGGERDEEKLVELFKELNFESTVYRDQTAHQMMAHANQYSRDETHENAQAFVCVIMTHGESGQLYGVDGKLVSMVKIMEIIGECRQLKGKPKLFFVEACQSEGEGHMASSQGHGGLLCDNTNQPSAESQEVRRRLTPCAGDVLASFSTLPGKRAYRDPKVGTLYIQELCEVVTENRKAMDLEDMLKLMANQVKKNLELREYGAGSFTTPPQLPFYISTLDKRVTLSM